MKAYLVIEGAYYESSDIIASYFDKQYAVLFMEEAVNGANEDRKNWSIKNNKKIEYLFKKDENGNYDNGLDYYEIKEIEIL